MFCSRYLEKRSYKCLYICTVPSQILKESYEDKNKLFGITIGKNKNILFYLLQHIHQEIQRPLNFKFSVVILQKFCLSGISLVLIDIALPASFNILHL